MNKSHWIVLSLICFILGGIVYVGNHAEQIMKISAEYNLAKNNKEKALQQYENAFELGLKNRKDRKRYVQIVTEEPTNAVNQDKIYKFVTYDNDDVAKYIAENYLEDIKDTIKNKYPENYIKQVPYNHKVIRWSELPITYGFINSEKVPKYYLEEIVEAFKTIEEKTNKTITFKKNDTIPNIVIKFNEQQNSDENEDIKYVAAYTNPIIKDDALQQMDIEFFITTPEQEYFSENQIYNTALHEICHALGIMGHSDHSRDVMYMTVHPVVASNDLRMSLSNRDIGTIMLLYSTQPEITNKPGANSLYSPRLVLGDEAEISSAKIKEAREYIKKAPDLPMGYIDLAEGLVATKHYSKAIKYLEKALSLSDDNKVSEMIYYDLAVTYNLVNENEKAKYYLAKAMRIKDSELYHQLLAQIYISENSTNKAINEYEYLLTINPSNIDYAISLTNIYVRKHRYLMARKALKDFIKKNPEEKNNVRLAPYGIIKAFL